MFRAGPREESRRGPWLKRLHRATRRGCRSRFQNNLNELDEFSSSEEESEGGSNLDEPVETPLFRNPDTGHLHPWRRSTSSTITQPARSMLTRFGTTSTSQLGSSDFHEQRVEFQPNPTQLPSIRPSSIWRANQEHAHYSNEEEFFLLIANTEEAETGCII